MRRTHGITELGALSLAITLALGGCHDHTAPMDYKSSSAGVGLRGVALDPGHDSPQPDESPTCRFGYPGNFVDDYEYTGFVYRNPDPDHSLPGNKQIVDMKAIFPEGDEMWDVILWECQPPGLVATISMEGAEEAFNLEQIGNPDGRPYYITFRTDALPEPPPVGPDPITTWQRTFFLILWNEQYEQVELRRAHVTVRACNDALPPGVMECPSTPVGGQL